MAKNETSGNTSSAAVGIAPPAVDASTGGDSRSIVLQVPMQDGTTVPMKRTDYIRERAKAGADRGTIKKEVEKLQGKPVQYQVIFAATKGMYPGKGSKAEAAPATEGGAVSE
jgi:hypothetical protein